MLARQQQFGELGGEDAGTPAQVAFLQTEVALRRLEPAGGAVLPYSPQADVVEALVAGEAAGPAHSTLDRLQAGRALAAALPAAVAAQAAHRVRADARARLRRGCWRARQPVSPTGSPSPPRSPAPPPGTDAALGAALKLPAADATAARADLAEFARWCAITFGTGPSSWMPERLERRFELAADGQPCSNAPGHARERVDWHDFDFARRRRPPAHRDRRPTTTAPGAARSTRSRAPRADGDPVPRPAARPLLGVRGRDARRSPASTRRRVTSAALRSSNSARSTATTGSRFPIPITYGSLQTSRELVVRDSFGTHELIAPAADPHWAHVPAGRSPTRSAGARRAGDDGVAARRRRRRGGRFPARRHGDARLGVEQIVTDAGRHPPRPCRTSTCAQLVRADRDHDRTRTSPTA